jgi:parallel beta-helix repeat protein
MARTNLVVLVIGLTALGAGLLRSSPSSAQVQPATGKTYYVRQTVGNDANDGLSPASAWQHVAKLSRAVQAGDTAYVGPGLYREELIVLNSGTADRRLTLVADTTGRYTGDPPGVVMITGAEPVDGDIFVPQGRPGVYTAHFSAYPVRGVVEMDGPQYRYWQVKSAKELPLRKGVSELDLVAKQPATYFWDEGAKILSLHTSDGAPPKTHEMEFIRRGNGIAMADKPYITVIGFTFRHVADAGINFFRGSNHGVAVDNTAYGSRQGIRVFASTDVLLYGNTLFRNENSGAYFLAASTGGLAIGNVAYENVKGLRWSSRSASGVAIDDALFDNHERGLAIENATPALLRGNRLVNNQASQLLVIQTVYDADANCFENRDPAQLTADFVFVGRYKALADYQRAQGQDMHSREGGCGPLAKKVDVRKLHAESLAYLETARRILNGAQEGGAKQRGP